MRKPSSYRQLYGWWLGAIAGRNPPRHDGVPECGFFKKKLVRGGPWVPVRIFVERDIDPETGELTSDERFVWEMEGIRQDTHPGAEMSWLTPISKEEYDRLNDKRLRDPRFFDATKPVDLAEAPTLPPGVV